MSRGGLPGEFNIKHWAWGLTGKLCRKFLISHLKSTHNLIIGDPQLNNEACCQLECTFFNYCFLRRPGHTFIPFHLLNHRTLFSISPAAWGCRLHAEFMFSAFLLCGAPQAGETFGLMSSNINNSQKQRITSAIHSLAWWAPGWTRLALAVPMADASSDPFQHCRSEHPGGWALRANK